MKKINLSISHYRTYYLNRTNRFFKMFCKFQMFTGECRANNCTFEHNCPLYCVDFLKGKCNGKNCDNFHPYKKCDYYDNENDYQHNFNCMFRHNPKSKWMPKLVKEILERDAKKQKMSLPIPIPKPIEKKEEKKVEKKEEKKEEKKVEKKEEKKEEKNAISPIVQSIPSAFIKENLNEDIKKMLKYQEDFKNTLDQQFESIKNKYLIKDITDDQREQIKQLYIDTFKNCDYITIFLCYKLKLAYDGQQIKTHLVEVVDDTYIVPTGSSFLDYDICGIVRECNATIEHFKLVAKKST